MNAYEQLLVIRDRLELNGASEDSIMLVDKFLDRATSERESATSVPLVTLLRHLLRQREAIDNYAIYNDLQELMEEGSPPPRDEDRAPNAYEEEHRPRAHSFYKQQKTKEREAKK